MKRETFAELITERQQAIEFVVARIAQHAESADLRDLQVLLVDLTGVLRRNPGIEANADDVYAAAAAVVRDRRAGSQPVKRKLRLLKDASQRLRERLAGAAERVGPQELPRLHGLEVLYAAHKSFDGPVAGGEFRMPSIRALPSPCFS